MFLPFKSRQATEEEMAAQNERHHKEERRAVSVNLPCADTRKHPRLDEG